MVNRLRVAEFAKEIVKKEPFINPEECYFIKIEEISYDNDYPRREALENIFTALANNLRYSFVYLLRGNGEKIDLYLGVTRNYRFSKDKIFHTYDIGKLLKETFIGNFQGSHLKEINRTSDVNRKLFSLS